MFIELDKYKTGDSIENQKQPNGEIKPIKVVNYNFNWGSLLNDFIDHKNKPFWKRKKYHKDLTATYIGIINYLYGQLLPKTGEPQDEIQRPKPFEVQPEFTAGITREEVLHVVD